MKIINNNNDWSVGKMQVEDEKTPTNFTNFIKGIHQVIFGNSIEN